MIFTNFRVLNSTILNSTILNSIIHIRSTPDLEPFGQSLQTTQQHNNTTTQQHNTTTTISMSCIEEPSHCRKDHRVYQIRELRHDRSNFSIVHINVVSFVIQSQCSTRVLSTHSTSFRQYSQIGCNSLILYQITGGRNASVGFQKSNKTLRGEMKKAMIMAMMNDGEHGIQVGMRGNSNQSCSFLHAYVMIFYNTNSNTI